MGLWGVGPADDDWFGNFEEAKHVRDAALLPRLDTVPAFKPAFGLWKVQSGTLWGFLGALNFPDKKQEICGAAQLSIWAFKVESYWKNF